MICLFIYVCFPCTSPTVDLYRSIFPMYIYIYIFIFHQDLFFVQHIFSLTHTHIYIYVLYMLVKYQLVSQLHHWILPIATILGTTDDTIYCGWLRDPAPVEIVNIPLFLGFNRPFGGAGFRNHPQQVNIVNIEFIMVNSGY